MNEPTRPLRADAARNREQLLAAAEEEFAEKGPGVSVSEIAARAGLGKGTFFRHFASKDDMIAAVVTEHVTTLIDVGESLIDADDPADGLLEFLTVAAAQRQQRDVSFLLRAGETDPRVVTVRDRLYSTIGTLVDRARQAGTIRTDVGATDVILLMCAPDHVVEHVSNANSDLWRRYLAIIFDGLRPEGAHTLPVDPPMTPY
ncbi:TetR/AcrR family transcriptional regulator [Rhodococcus qingshengii]